MTYADRDLEVRARGCLNEERLDFKLLVREGATDEHGARDALERVDHVGRIAEVACKNFNARECGKLGGARVVGLAAMGARGVCGRCVIRARRKKQNGRGHVARSGREG